MRNVSGKTVLLTGATGGLGTYMAHMLAERGTNLTLAAFPGIELERLTREVEGRGVRANMIPIDFRTTNQLHLVVEKAEQEYGGVDILINNAGVELTAAYHEFPEKTIQEILTVNLIAPMLLTRLVLPRMLERGWGHIVNISSLAGKAGPAYQAPYAASKAALIAFTSSLRATYQGTGVSASVICPGFCEAGIYTKMKAETGITAPITFGTSRPERVAEAVVRSIERDLPEVLISPYPVRPLFAVMAMFPSVGEWLMRSMGAHAFFRRVAEAERKKGQK